MGHLQSQDHHVRLDPRQDASGQPLQAFFSKCRDENRFWIFALQPGQQIGIILDAVDLVEHHHERTGVGAELHKNPIDGLHLFLEFVVAGVDHMEQQIGLNQHLQGAVKAGHQMVG